ncbi:hypothetical protein V2J09_020337 [Rumex salicifolius]
MRGFVILLLVLTVWGIIECKKVEAADNCQFKRSFKERPHSISISEFGAVGDGKTMNTVAFQNAIFYVKSFADKGGAQLYVPPGRWLTGCLNLTSHLTLFLERGAVILATQDYSRWPVADPFPSYGRGLDVPGKRYSSLITGNHLRDIIITGDNGTINGQGSVWWEQYTSGSLKYSRPHLLELINSNDIVVSNITFSNPPGWSIHPVYCNILPFLSTLTFSKQHCSNVLIENVAINAPQNSPYTNGIVPDSSEDVCIGYSNISVGYDAVVMKSGWDEYGIAYNKPTTNVQIQSVRLQSFSGAGLAVGSEMSGGISNITAKDVHFRDSYTGIALRTSRGRGGYIVNMTVSDATMENVFLAIQATGFSESHPDERFDANALPIVKGVGFSNMVGTNISISGNFSGIYESPFTSFVLSNVTFEVRSSDGTSSWACSNVLGSSKDVLPEPCPELEFGSLTTYILSVKKGNGGRSFLKRFV